MISIAMRMLNESAVQQGVFMIEPNALVKLREHLPKNFNNIFLLTRALTHRSYLNENREVLEDNERLVTSSLRLGMGTTTCMRL